MALYRELLCTFCALIAAFGLTAGQDRAALETGACTETRDAYRDKGFSANDVPLNAIASKLPHRLSTFSEKQTYKRNQKETPRLLAYYLR